MIQSISNNLLHVYQNHFLETNFYNQTISLLNQVPMRMIQGKIIENAKRIVPIVLLVFGLIALCSLAIQCASMIGVGANRIKTHPPFTLASAFSAAKADFIARNILDNSEFKDATSAKIFLTIKHKDRFLSESHITSTINPIVKPPIVQKDVIAHLDSLFNKLQASIEFDAQLTTRFQVGILLKNRSISEKPPLFSQITAEVTVNKEKTFNFDFTNNTKLNLNNRVQEIFCQLIDIPFVPQLDAKGDFI